MWVRSHNWGAALLLLFLFVGPASAAAPRTLIAKVERVSDGDTITAMTANSTKLRLRLLGIDAPEIAHGSKPGQPFGEEARDYLDHLIGGKTVRVDAYGPDYCDSWEARTGEMADESTKPVDGGNPGQDL